MKQDCSVVLLYAEKRREICNKTLAMHVPKFYMNMLSEMMIALPLIFFDRSLSLGLLCCLSLKLD